MTKKHTGGQSYLRTTVKFDFKSMVGLDQEAQDVFRENLMSKLFLQLGSFDKSQPTTSAGHEFKNERISIGLQPVFDLLAENSAQIVLLDSMLTKATAVSSIIALYVKNSGATAYSIVGLTKLLSNLDIKADAVATTVAAEETNNFLKSSALHPITFLSASKLRPPVVTLSQGKKSKKTI